MNLYGILIAKNEGDIIEQTLLSLRQYGGFKKIFFFDNGSTDNTVVIAKKFNDLLASVTIVSQPFSDTLKYQLLYQQSAEYRPGDWLAILDADEFLTESALDKISVAEQAGANCIEYKSAQFYMTEQDDSRNFSPSKPAIEQRQHYLINYGEPHFFKYSPAVRLTEFTVKQKFDWLRSSPEKLLVNHFQFRSAQQIQQRIDIRIANHSASRNWNHVKNSHWQDYLVNSAWLHKFDGEYVYGLPKNINLYKIPNNCAYTATILRWLNANHYLTDDQKAFLTANRLKRFFLKYF
ncbi:MAG: glycosyltransferase family 2 protein [Methylococcales bacterium]|nr:glycosyltransferase family 2 protein [Methylococcales bacterium]